jgi:Outer membrane protein beta-barrel domain
MSTAKTIPRLERGIDSVNSPIFQANRRGPARRFLPKAVEHCVSQATRAGLSTCLFIGLLMLATSQASSAQDQYTRSEFGGEFSTIRQNNAQTGDGKNFPGFGGRYDWNFNRRLAFETQVDFFPQQSQVINFLRGGQTLEAVFGLRAKVVQTRRVSVFGLIRPGLFHYTAVLAYSPGGGLPTQQLGATYFELNLGGGIEYYLRPRWVLRADIEGNPYRVARQTRSTPVGTVSYPGSVEDTTRLSFGVAYRPGSMKQNEAENQVPGTGEFGPLISTLIAAPAGPDSGVATLYGLGAYATYRIWRVLYLDSDVLYFPQDTHGSSNLYGGPVFQGLFGVKGGIRRNRFGFFGKVRPGLQTYAQALDSITTQPSGVVDSSYGRSTNFVLDLGGIVEFYPTESTTLRIEAGDTHTFFSPHTVIVNGTPLRYDLGMHHTIQFVFGYGWRF